MSNKKPRCTKIEYDKRVLTVQMWIVDGVQSSLIVQQILQKQWCDSTRHAERILADARDRWIDAEEKDINRKRTLKIQELKQIKRSLMDRYKGTPEGIQAQILVEREIIKLEGLATPKKVELTGKDGKPMQVENTSNIDYSMLPDEILEAIVQARKNEDN